MSAGQPTGFAGRLAQDLAAAASGTLVLIGDRLGLYRAMAGAGPIDSVELARRTGTAERYVREWLAAQAACGYVNYDEARGTYTLDAEQAAQLADDGGAHGLLGNFEAVASLWRDEPKLTRAFRTGEGVAWEEHHPSLFRGIERALAASWARHLLQEWIPAAPQVHDALTRGARVADIGCRSGALTRLLASAFPESTFVGFDSHAPSIERARVLAAQMGLDSRIRYQVSTAKEFPGGEYSLVTSFHCLLDLGDPAGAVRHVRNVLARGGRFLVAEPAAGDTLAENLTPTGRFFYAYSTCVSIPASRRQEVGACLGSQAGEKRIRGVLNAGGFARVRTLARTDRHLVFEAQP